MIVIEHKTDWLLKHANRVLVLDSGRFILDGKPLEVFKKFGTLERIGIEVPKVLRIGSQRSVPYKQIRLLNSMVS